MPSPQVVEQGPQAVLQFGQGASAEAGVTRAESWCPCAVERWIAGVTPWSHTHSGQHLPGTCILLGRGQSQLGSRTSSLHSGRQVKPPSSQRHRTLQLGLKVSPSRYLRPFTSQLPSSSSTLREGRGRKWPEDGSVGCPSCHRVPCGASFKPEGEAVEATTKVSDSV